MQHLTVLLVHHGAIVPTLKLLSLSIHNLDQPPIEVEFAGDTIPE